MQAEKSRTKARDRLILAVDTADIDEARRYLDELQDYVGVFKIGLQLYTHYGPEILRIFQDAGARIFLDCKFLDIPNTVAKAAQAASAHGVFMFTVHASGGSTMLRAAADAVAKQHSLNPELTEPLILAVTVLTSMSEAQLKNELACEDGLKEHVLRLARLAKENGISGLVASPEELPALKAEFAKNLTVVTPGVRPSWAEANDQSRINTPFDAIKKGADYLVVGRPILAAQNRRDAAKKIIEEIEAALD